MDYFSKLQELLGTEQQEDRTQYAKLTAATSAADRRSAGLTWYPVAIRHTEMSRGDYLNVELERTTHHELPHQFRFGMPAAIFSNHDPQEHRVEGVLSFVGGNRLSITLRTEELPEWADKGKLGVDLLFDDNSYSEMRAALKKAASLIENREEGTLTRILTGQQPPSFRSASGTPTGGAAPEATGAPADPHFYATTGTPAGPALNPSQQAALEKISLANELAIIHGPPGTGKTTMLIQAIRALIQQHRRQVLVAAPSNAAVDLLAEKLSIAGLNVIRIGNPVRVSERLTALTLDSQVTGHNRMKEIKKLKKQAAEFRNMAQKYKRNFGKAEREQRKALLSEARNILKQVVQDEQYIIENLLQNADVIAATLVGANHYTLRERRFDTVVIDEAGQASEPACWIPSVKTNRLVMAGDPFQLPPTIKSAEAAAAGLATTLMEKCMQLYPNAVVMLDEQYRMHEQIMEYSSEVFYANKMKAHPSVAQHVALPGDQPLVFIDTAGCGYDEKQEGFSVANPEEASFLLKHLAAFVARLADRYTREGFPSIAVVSPYNRQIELLKEYLPQHPALEARRAHIAVNTIDSFQGQERDIVYISMTRSNPESRIGFLADIRRMNVAMTRARKKLVVIGDGATLSQLPFYEDFIKYAESRQAYCSAWEFADL